METPDILGAINSSEKRIKNHIDTMLRPIQKDVHDLEVVAYGQDGRKGLVADVKKLCDGYDELMQGHTNMLKLLYVIIGTTVSGLLIYLLTGTV